MALADQYILLPSNKITFPFEERDIDPSKRLAFLSFHFWPYTNSQYIAGAISAPDLLRSLERDVADKIQGCDLEDVLAAALEAIPDKRKRDLLAKAR